MNLHYRGEMAVDKLELVSLKLCALAKLCRFEHSFWSEFLFNRTYFEIIYSLVYEHKTDLYYHDIISFDQNSNRHDSHQEANSLVAFVENPSLVHTITEQFLIESSVC